MTNDKIWERSESSRAMVKPTRSANSRTPGGAKPPTSRPRASRPLGTSHTAGTRTGASVLRTLITTSMRITTVRSIRITFVGPSVV